jgi:hypothetical protein
MKPHAATTTPPSVLSIAALCHKQRVTLHQNRLLKRRNFKPLSAKPRNTRKVKTHKSNDLLKTKAPTPWVMAILTLNLRRSCPRLGTPTLRPTKAMSRRKTVRSTNLWMTVMTHRSLQNKTPHATLPINRKRISTMKSQTLSRLMIASASALLTFSAQAQMPAANNSTNASTNAPPNAPALRGESPSRMQMKMDRDEFLRTHVWSETTGYWNLKDDVDLPSGVKSRTDVKSERDQFLRNNRWSATEGWVPTKTPRNLGTMSRAEVRADTSRFLTTHRWDESTSAWVEKAPRKNKGG